MTDQVRANSPLAMGGIARMLILAMALAFLWLAVAWAIQ
jgi:hypothetical protein